MVLCKKCHDWTDCPHCRFAMDICARCGKYGLTAECFVRKPIPVRIPEEERARIHSRVERTS